MLLSSGLLPFAPVEPQALLALMCMVGRDYVRTSFGDASDDLCTAIALFTRYLCFSYIDPRIVAPLMVCRLIASNKNPVVHPIGVCEVVRDIIAKACLSVVTENILKATGSRKLCAGQIAGAEAAVHAMHSVFKQSDTEAMLLVDASNAFNSLNRVVALHNIRTICSPIATILINTYWIPAHHFVRGETLLSEEGTTQGDLVAMPMYALATLPLINQLTDEVTQIWYADDAGTCGSISALRKWWDQLFSKGPGFGYHVNDSKTWLVTKEDFTSRVKEVFVKSAIKPHQ